MHETRGILILQHINVNFLCNVIDFKTLQLAMPPARYRHPFSVKFHNHHTLYSGNNFNYPYSPITSLALALAREVLSSSLINAIVKITIIANMLCTLRHSMNNYTAHHATKCIIAWCYKGADMAINTVI